MNIKVNLNLKKKHNLEMKSSRESAQIHININILDNSTYSFWDKKFERKHIDFFLYIYKLNNQYRQVHNIKKKMQAV